MAGGILIIMVTAVFLILLQEIKDRNWQQACELVDCMNLPLARENLAYFGTESDINVRTMIQAALIPPSQFEAVLNQLPRGTGVYSTNQIPPPNEPIVAGSDGNRTHPKLDPGWQLYRDFPTLNNP